MTAGRRVQMGDPIQMVQHDDAVLHILKNGSVGHGNDIQNSAPEKPKPRKDTGEGKAMGVMSIRGHGLKCSR
jgi:hypothetical protein